MLRARVAAALITILAACCGITIIAGDSVLESRTLALAGGSITVVAEPLEALEATDRLRVGWEAFRARHGGAWRIYLDERSGLPTLVSGRGIEWLSKAAQDSVTLPQLEALARSFLIEQRSLMGDWETMLELDPQASTKIRPGHWQLVFRQLVDGVRVENARIDFQVKQGRLVLFGASHWALPTTNGVPSIDTEQALDALRIHLGPDAPTLLLREEAELTILAVDADPSSSDPAEAWSGARGDGIGHRLLYRFRFDEPGSPSLWVAEVDAHDGSVLSFHDDARHASVRGAVFPSDPGGDCANGGCEVQGFPMPFTDFTEAGQPLDYADAFGNLQCADPGASFQTALSGPYVTITDRCGTVDESGTCADGIDLGTKAGENCAVQLGASAGNTAAARTGFYHINRAAEVARFYDPANSWIRSPLQVIVNIDGSCNAWWNGDLNMYWTESRCNNTAEMQDLLIHEWGHGYDQNDGGGYDKNSEAYADVVAIFGSRDSCMSPGFYNDGSTCEGYGNTCLSCTGLRDFDWAAKIDNTPVTPSGFIMTSCPTDFSYGGPCRKEGHCESYLISETIYDFATRDLPASGMDPDSSWQLAERLWYETRPGSGGDIYFCYLPNANSCGATHWYQRMLVADDDDGDLSNGTPHAAAMFAAFDRHDVACGTASDPENQSTSSCPALATPLLSIVETVGGTELSWAPVSGAASYRVYRGELGCNRQQVPLADVAGTTYLDTVADQELVRQYRVEAFGSNPACHSLVSNCESTPAVALLQKTTHRLIEPAGSINDIPDPGETVQIPVSLFNAGDAASYGTVGQLRLVESATGRVLQPNATWNDVPAGLELESNAPHFEVTVLEQTSCGDTLTFEVDYAASNSAGETRVFQYYLDPADCEPLTCAEATPGATTGMTLEGTLAGSQVDLQFSWNAASGASGYHVLQSDSAEFDSTVDLLGRTAGTTIFATTSDASTPGLTFFQVRGTNSCNQEGL